MSMRGSQTARDLDTCNHCGHTSGVFDYRNWVQKIDEEAYFIVDTLGYFNQITRFDLILATQTILATPFDSVSPVAGDTEIEVVSTKSGGEKTWWP